MQTQALQAPPAAGGHGQCFLAKVSSDLVLSPYNGNKLIINSVVRTIPDAGVSLTASGLSTSTLYYIYAFMNSGTMTLEASATGHSAQAGTGVEIKTGDATRTLVGMAYVITGPIDYVAPSRNRSALKLPRPNERPYARLASYWRGMRNPRTCS